VTLFASPPPPPLRPANDTAPAASDLEFEDAPPPVRTPTPEVIRLVPKQRPHSERDFDTTGPNTPVGRRAEADFDDPYLRDALPVTHHRLALAILGLLAIGVFLAVTGAYRGILASARRQLGLRRPVPAAAPAAAPATEVPPVTAPATPPAQEPTAPTRSVSPPPAEEAAPAKPAPAHEAAAPPAKPKATATERHHEASAPRHHRRDEEPGMIKRPGSIYLSPPAPSPSTPAPEPSAPARTAATRNPFAQPPGTPPPDLGKLPDQFTIPPPAPTGEAPSRDLAPPPLPEAEPSAPGPQITPAPTPPPGPPPSAPPPGERAPGDQPMPPSF
jgi:hypothetical protein